MGIKHTVLILSVLLSISIATAFSSSVSFDDPETTDYSERDVEAVCGDVDVNSQDVDVDVNETEVTFSGLYCANTGGYTITEQDMNSTDGEIRAVVEIEEPRDDQVVTTVITPVEFNMTEEFDDGVYEFVYDVKIANETLESDAQEIEIGDIEDTTIFGSIVNWFATLF